MDDLTSLLFGLDTFCVFDVVRPARLHEESATAITGSNRTVIEVTMVYGVGWHTAHAR